MKTMTLLLMAAIIIIQSGCTKPSPEQSSAGSFAAGSSAQDAQNRIDNPLPSEVPASRQENPQANSDQRSDQSFELNTEQSSDQTRSSNAESNAESNSESNSEPKREREVSPTAPVEQQSTSEPEGDSVPIEINPTVGSIEEPSEKSSEEFSEESSRKTTNQTSIETSKKSLSQTSNKTSNDTWNENSNKNSKKASNGTSEESTKGSAKEPGKTAKDPAKNANSKPSKGLSSLTKETSGSSAAKAEAAASTAVSQTKPKGVSTIGWSGFFDNEDQTTPSNQFWDLSGTQVEINGYMGEVLSFDKNWFLLIPQPGAECPFDNGDETYWNKIMIVFVPDDTKLRHHKGPLKITGRLDVGIKIDESGYKTMFRLYDASFEEIVE